jgi:hypothetical protein
MCPYGCGTVFQLDPPSQPGGSWTKQTLYSLHPVLAYPAALLLGANGGIYGAAEANPVSPGCPAGNCGLFYGLTPPAQPGGTWTVNNIGALTNKLGQSPNTPLVQDAHRVLYDSAPSGGITGNQCGDSGCGTAISLSPPVFPSTEWTVKEIHRFQGGNDGFHPSAGMVIAPDGTLYGTTYYGGGLCQVSPFEGCGIVFRSPLRYRLLPRGQRPLCTSSKVQPTAGIRAHPKVRISPLEQAE